MKKSNYHALCNISSSVKAGMFLLSADEPLAVLLDNDAREDNVGEIQH